MAKKASNPIKFFNDKTDERVKKMQTGGTPDFKGGFSKPSKDSTSYFDKKNKSAIEASDRGTSEPPSQLYLERANEAASNTERQLKKGRPGYDANGYPKKQNGGSIKSKK